LISTAIISAVAFLSTNIDDIFLLTLLFSAGNMRKSNIYIGHFLGIMILSIISCLGAYGLTALFEKYVFMLGLVPIFLGIKAIFDRDDDENISIGGSILSVILLTVLSGGDNIGVYIPIFARMNVVHFITALAIFGIMSVMWCFIAQRLSVLPALRRFIEKYKRVIVPVIFILLGIFIIFGI